MRLWFTRAPDKGTIGGMLTGDFAFDNFFWLHRMQSAFKAWHAQTAAAPHELHQRRTDAQLNEPDKVLIVRARWTRCSGRSRNCAAASYTARYAVTSKDASRVPRADAREPASVQTLWPNIAACGDWLGYPSPSLWMERSCVTAIAAANHVLQREGLEPYPILEPPQAGWLARGLVPSCAAGVKRCSRLRSAVWRGWCGSARGATQGRIC
ncbi:MAG: hypothetical protein U0694_17870 [Anaerolineae bacterium]